VEPFLNAKSDHFTKTGSGQTQEKLMKEWRFPQAPRRRCGAQLDDQPDWERGNSTRLHGGAASLLKAISTKFRLIILLRPARDKYRKS
jgi:hypothetical protein